MVRAHTEEERFFSDSKPMRISCFIVTLIHNTGSGAGRKQEEKKWFATFTKADIPIWGSEVQLRRKRVLKGFIC